MMQFGKHQLKFCKYGWMLFHGPYIGKCFELYGQYSESEVRIMRSVLRAGDVAIDVGANIGDLTLPMARLVGATGRVFAIESHADHFHTLCANLCLNEIKHARAINAFIADSETADTAGPWGKFGYVSETFGPPIMRLDSLALDSCAFIKIDVDGKELEVLQSAEATIAKTRPVIYLENDIQEKSAALLEHLLQRDYTLFWHQAPIFEPDNFFGNPVNHWAPQRVVSLMMLCIPSEKAGQLSVTLKRVTDKDEWWDL
jgi:FkbM family methyltransferase